MSLKLSVLDQSPVLPGFTPQDALNQTTELAKFVDKLGYHRFWVSEHHSTKTLAGSAPEILITHLAANTERIRVGTGGILLPHYSSFKVAEMFRVLESLYPGRIDLGIGRAPGGMPGVNYALNKGKYPNVQDYPQQVQELMSYLQGRKHQTYKVKATPLGDTWPPIWMLGSSGTSATLAAQLGASYTFAQFINGEGGTGAMDAYFNCFQPSEYRQEPEGSVAIFVICAPTEKEAEYLAKSLDLQLLRVENGDFRDEYPTPEEAANVTYTYFEEERVRHNRNRMIVGDPVQVRERLEQLAKAYRVNEIIVNTIATSTEKRFESYQLIMDAFQKA
ncbi:LLM class flavin-dependent oxidoreductase [Salinibacillus xinjiangensis]|uniref:MsnO8 family LLM class oxidoreductase n=1 Tax=Salinibacillus xinjiangensis TaxID=1229268 RepID=A0A6G1X8G7_9BACI|nr:LLM class flavin-dependent oxidoreductase [Salinibacillus xinjiangensis]MRG87237.1 MsnO8 family LLM class oxidoreductase [Salinibacillus xinjiangensis]